MIRIPRAALVASLCALSIPVAAAAQDAQCRALRFRGNFRTNGAMQHLGQADSTSFPDVKRSRAGRALGVLNEAAQAGGVDPFTLWFMFGRVYSHQNDLVGADSAFAKAAALVQNDPQCQAEITRLRKNLWIPLQNEAVSLMQGQNYDSALVLLRKSNLIYRDDPSGFMNMASAFRGKNQDDSAAAMYRLAAHAGTSADRADLRAQAAMSAARLYMSRNNHVAAESAFRDYIAMRPRDMAAKGALATALSAQNRSAEAGAVYDSMLANADSLDAFQLLEIGVSLFNLAVADSASANAARRTAFFRRAASAFEAGLRKNPNYRDAHFFLTRTYLAANDTAKMLEAAQRLVAVDSMNRQTLNLLARAYQMNRRANDVVAVLTKRDSLPLEIVVQRFEPRDSTASIRGGVQNLQGRERPGFNLVIEFLNGRGEVVATERVDVPTLGATGSPGSAYDFNLQVNGRGIVAYRYKIA